MAVSGKTAAPYEIPYFLGTDKPPDMAAVTKAIADRVHALAAGRWYAPKIITAEESRTSTEFGFLTSTEDKIEGVVVPTGGLLLLNFHAQVKSSVAAAGRVVPFIGSNNLFNPGGSTNAEAKTEGTSFVTINSGPTALEKSSTAAEEQTSGQVVGAALEIFVAAGTYTVSVKYAATSGSITAKNRRLYVRVLG